MAQSVPVGALLKDVEVSDPLNETQRRNISNVLTTQIAQHIDRGEYFERMISFPPSWTSETLSCASTSPPSRARNETQRRNISNVLTTQIAQHIDRGEYFERMISFPPSWTSETLSCASTSPPSRASAHAPGIFPGCAADATMWIWVNGPIYVDKYDLRGELTIDDAAGKQVAHVEKVWC